MTSDLEKLMANLSTMLAELPPDTQAELMRRLAARLESTPLEGGALVPARADVIQDALERECDDGQVPPTNDRH
jgi:hypothetical protein